MKAKSSGSMGRVKKGNGSNVSETEKGRSSNIKSKSNKKGWRKAVDEAIDSTVSDLSDSTEDGIDDDADDDNHYVGSKRRSKNNNGGGSLADGGRSEDYENFEKVLRNKHSKACKAMSVSDGSAYFFTAVCSFFHYCTVRAYVFAP